MSSREYPERPVLGVGAVIVVEERDRARLDGCPPVPSPCGVVLIRRRFEPLAGEWSLPGGIVEVGETLEAAVAREALEETGLVIGVGPVVEVLDRIMLDAEQRVRYHFVLVDYLCRPVGGRLGAASDAADVAIADPADLSPFRLTAKAGAVIRKALSGNRALSNAGG